MTAGDDIVSHVENSAQEADYQTELRKTAALIERSGLSHTAHMMERAAAELDRLHAQNERMRKTLREVEPFLTGLPYPKRDQLHALVVSTLKDQP